MVGAAVDDATAAPVSPAEGVRVVCTAGPAAGGSWTLGRGRHIVGRSAGVSVRVPDRTLEPHHVALDVAADDVRVLHLAGRAPSVGALGVGDVCEIGASRFRIEPLPHERAVHSASRAQLASDPWRVIHHRPPRPPRPEPPRAVQAPAPPAPDPDEGAGGLAASVLGLIGAVSLAVVMRQPMFAMFGMMGALVGVGGWAAMKCSRRRRRRRAQRTYQQAIAQFDAELSAAHDQLRSAHEVSTADLATCLRWIEDESARLWERRVGDHDAFTVGIGVGDIGVEAPIIAESRRDGDREWLPAVERHQILRDVVVPACLAPGSTIGIVGSVADAAAVGRSFVVQLAAICGPADWELIVCVSDPSFWEWTSWLPHTESGPLDVDSDDIVAGAGRDAVGERRHLVVVTDRCDVLGRRTSPLRRLVESRRACVLAIAGDRHDLPASATSMLHVGERSRARWFADLGRPGLPSTVHAAGLGVDDALDAAARLARFVDPEQAGALASFPDDVDVLDLVAPEGLDVAQLVDTWTAHRVDDRVVATLGAALDGVVEIDLDRDGPHALVGGTTGSGKSELLRSFVASLAVHRSPDDLSIVLIDYKGGAAFDACAGLPHVVGVVTDLDARLADRALRSLDAELRRREALLRSLGASDLVSARRVAPDDARRADLARLVIVVDEFATLAAEHPTFLRSLVGIAQRGRSLGVHLVLATQRPSGVVDDDIRANTSIRVALRMHDTADSVDVIGVADAARLPRRSPGRAVLRLGADELIELQAARVVSPAQMSAIVATARAATRMLGCARPPAPWLPALASELVHDAVPPDAVGLVDRPDAQTQEPLRWQPSDGNLLLCGSVGSGVTSTAVAVVERLMARRSSERLHVYVIDGHGDARLAALERWPQCGGVIGLHEHERLRRALAHVSATAAGRAAQPELGDGPEVLLVVDGVEPLRAALDDDAWGGDDGGLGGIVRAAGAHGVVVLATARAATAVPAPMLARFTHRWAFHLTDRYEVSALGIAPGDAPPPIAGRCAVAPEGVHAQIIAPLPAEGPAAAPVSREGARPAPRVEPLPAVVPVDAIRSAVDPAADPDDVLLPIGLSFVDRAPATLSLPPGAHLAVVGPSRSGRSSALVRLARAWAAMHPDAAVRVVAPRRSPLRDEPWEWCAEPSVDMLATRRRLLVVVDDAELVDDLEASFARVFSDPRSRVTVAIASRADALRGLGAHWTSAVRRSRRGIVLTGGSELDGDVLGAILPRRLPSPAPPGMARPGLGWVIGDGEPVLVQVALDDAPDHRADIAA